MTVTLQDAQSQLEQLAAKADSGEEVLIIRDGAPALRLTAIGPAPPKRRLGTLEGLWNVPDDFDTMFQAEIEEMFYGDPHKFNR